MPAKRPAISDREADIAIPRRVWSAWVPQHAPRAVVRALTEDERVALVTRRNELADGLQPFVEVEIERKAVEAALSAMLGGFHSLRERDGNAEAMVLVLMDLLREFPAWAIAEGCKQIRTGRAGIGTVWPPSDAQVYEIVAKIVAHYRSRLTQAEALLAAPVDPPRPHVDPPLPDPNEQRVMNEQFLEQCRKTPQQRSDENLRRVLADIEARKAQRETA